MNANTTLTPQHTKPWRILIVEDNPGDAVLVQEIFDDVDVTIERLEHVTTLSAAIDKLGTSSFDAIILDLGLPDGFGIDCIRTIRATKRDVPIVVLTGVDDDRLAVACIAAGAHDYLRKNSTRAQDLRRAVGFAVARSHELAERNRAHAFQVQLAAIVESSSDAIFTCSSDGLVTSWNRGAEGILGYSRYEVLGKPLGNFIENLPQEANLVFSNLTVAADHDAASLGPTEIDCLTKSGQTVCLSVVASKLHDLRGAIVGIAVTLRDVTELKQREHELRLRNAELSARNRQMRALAKRLDSVREAERKRIAHEVHDELGQMLTGVKMDLRWIGRRLEPIELPSIVPVKARTQDAENLVDATISTVQRIAIELRPSVLDAIGLSSAIRDEARRFENRTSILVKVRAVGLREPPPDVATAFFRIFQELLTNVARHARATLVEVDFEEWQDVWLLRVTDDGVGMPMAALESTSALGLLGIRERAAALGGTAKFEIGAKKGTIVTIVAPHSPGNGATQCVMS